MINTLIEKQYMLPHLVRFCPTLPGFAPFWYAFATQMAHFSSRSSSIRHPNPETLEGLRRLTAIMYCLNYIHLQDILSSCMITLYHIVSLFLERGDPNLITNWCHMKISCKYDLRNRNIWSFLIISTGNPT